MAAIMRNFDFSEPHKELVWLNKPKTLQQCAEQGKGLQVTPVNIGSKSQA